MHRLSIIIAVIIACVYAQDDDYIEITAYVGSNLTLPCNTTKNEPRVNWLVGSHDDNYIGSIYDSYGVIRGSFLKYSIDHRSLTIWNLDEYDTQKYYCVLYDENGEGRWGTKYKVTVTDSPDVKRHRLIQKIQRLQQKIRRLQRKLKQLT